jgi:hypothetical protein
MIQADECSPINHFVLHLRVSIFIIYTVPPGKCWDPTLKYKVVATFTNCNQLTLYTQSLLKHKIITYGTKAHVEPFPPLY